MDKQEAIFSIEDHIRVHRIGKYPHIHIAEALKMAMEALRAQPIVHCADCKWWDAVTQGPNVGRGVCKPTCGGYCVRRGATNADDFCSRGEVGQWQDRHKHGPQEAGEVDHAE